MLDTWPYLTESLPPLGGRIKLRPEDFRVEEEALYELSGEGTHTWFYIEKTGVSTMRLVHAVAVALGVGPREIGIAGLKDADAVARQWLSVEHVDPARLERLNVPRMRVLKSTRHANKLQIGHLRGNRFAIKLRDVDTARVDEAHEAIGLLARRGAPNYFGPQRFGARGDTWEVGRAMLRLDFAEAIDVMLGRPGPADHGPVLAAREAYERGDYGKAARLWPHHSFDERRACSAMAKTKGNAKRAFASVDKRLKRLYVSAYQSYLFNRIVAARISELDRLKTGDLAWLHAKGAVFRVEDAETEQPRCDAFEISPTGPLFGYRMTQPGGGPGDAEAAVLADEGLTEKDFRAPGAHKIKGGRRPMRFAPDDWQVEPGTDDAGPFIEFRFFLDPGCYATALLREICKAPMTASRGRSKRQTDP